MMWLTLLLSIYSQSCLASLVDVTVSPTGMRELIDTHKHMRIHARTKTHSTSQHPHIDPWQSQSDATATPLSDPLTPSFLLPLFLLATPVSTPIPASRPHSFLLVAMEMANKAITFTNFLRDRCWHNDCFLADWKGKGQEGSMGTPGGHSEGCPSVFLPGPNREKKANLLSLFSQGGGMQEKGGVGREAGGGRRASG